MNIYLITIGAVGFIGIIRARKSMKMKEMEERERWETETTMTKRNKSFIDCWQEVHRSTKEYIFANVIYKLLYIFSLCQIRYNKVVRYFCQNHKKIETKRVVYLGSNGKICFSVILFKNAKTKEYSAKEYSGLFLSDGPNMIFYEKMPDNFDYNVASFHFLNVDLEYNGKMYPMHLKTDSVNYYIVNNSLNAFFVKYYIQNVLKLTINENEKFQYTIHIIDHNVNCITLNQVQRLTLEENGYEIE